MTAHPSVAVRQPMDPSYPKNVVDRAKRGHRQVTRRRNLPGPFPP